MFLDIDMTLNIMTLDITILQDPDICNLWGIYVILGVLEISTFVSVRYDHMSGYVCLLCMRQQANFLDEVTGLHIIGHMYFFHLISNNFLFILNPLLLGQ